MKLFQGFSISNILLRYMYGGAFLIQEWRYYYA